MEGWTKNVVNYLMSTQSLSDQAAAEEFSQESKLSGIELIENYVESENKWIKETASCLLDGFYEFDLDEQMELLELPNDSISTNVESIENMNKITSFQI